MLQKAAVRSAGELLPGEARSSAPQPAHVGLDARSVPSEPRRQHPFRLGGKRGREQLERRRRELGADEVAGGRGQRVAGAAGDAG